MALKDDDPFSPPDYLSEHLFRSYSPVSYKETKPKPKAAPKPKTVAKQPTNRRIQKEGLYTKAQPHPAAPHNKKPTLFDQLRTIEKEKNRILKRYAELDQTANELIDKKT